VAIYNESRILDAGVKVAMMGETSHGPPFSSRIMFQ
jgi:hypothetical protein